MIPVFEPLALLNEIAIGLYPPLLKSVETPTESFIFYKVATFFVLSILFASKKEIATLISPTPKNLFLFVLQGGITFLVMTLTYYGFNELPLELGMSVFFSYPIIWVIISQLFIQSQPIKYLPAFLLSYVAMICIIRPNPKHIKQILAEHPEKQSKRIKAILSLLAGVAISAILFYIKRAGITTTNETFFRSSVGTLVYIIGYFLISGDKLDTNPNVWMKIVLFSGTLGFAATKFRMWGTQEHPVIYYSSFIFLGTALAYAVGKHIPQLKRAQHPDFADTK